MTRARRDATSGLTIVTDAAPRESQRSRLVAAAIALAACSSGSGASSTRARRPRRRRFARSARRSRATDVLVVAARTGRHLPRRIARTRCRMSSKNDPPRVYVPNSLSNSVDVIDPTTAQVVNHFAVGDLPQHVVPAWDLKTLYVTNDRSNSLTPIDPKTGNPGPTIPVDDPYNMYFTPDGKYAIVVAERLARLDFRDPHTFALVHSRARGLRWCRSRRLLRRRSLPDRELRVLGSDVEGRRAATEGDRHDRSQRRARQAAGREAGPDRARRSTSRT